MSMYDAERVKLITAENKLSKTQHCIQKYEESGYLSTDQNIILRQVLDDPIVPDKLRNAIKRAFATARADPFVEIPVLADSKKDKRNA